MMKIKNVWNVILKVLTYLRTHPEELLVHKIFIFFVFEDRDSRMDIRTVFVDEKFFGMRFYMCKNFEDDIPNMF